MQSSNDKDLRQIRLLAAAVAIVTGLAHIYYYCYQALAGWGLTQPVVDRVIVVLAHAGLYRHRSFSKLIVLLAMVGSALGTRAVSQPKSGKQFIILLSAGLLLYFGSDLILFIGARPSIRAVFYLVCLFAGGILLYGVIKSAASFLYWKNIQNIFNRYGESFPQEERLLTNEFSINLEARYTFRNQVRKSHINLIEIFAGTLVMGRAGSGKTRYIFRQMIQQCLAKNMAVFVYDLKYDDLTRLTYNTYLHSKNPALQFFSVNFDDFSHSHRCNPLDPASLEDLSDATESAKTILFALNKNWITRQGDFFISSAIAFLSAAIWFLRKIDNGRYCTLPHLIELLQLDYSQLFSVLSSFPETLTLIGSFRTAFANNVMEQLQGQIDSARIALSPLASPNIYYLLSANDFTLDINNAAAPKIVCIGSNPQKQFIYGAVVSLYVSRMLKLVNRKAGVASHLFFDEFSSFYASGIAVTLAQARSNKVAITIGIQDLTQLRQEYGRDQADALFNLPGNLICGRVSGDSARLVSEQFGRILQEKSSFSTNSRDSTSTQSQQLDLALPASKITTLSSGEFVGFTADRPNQKIALKGFHAEIVVDHRAIEQEEASYIPVPEVRRVSQEVVELNFRQIKTEVRDLAKNRLAYMMQTPELAKLILTKNKVGKAHRQSPD